MLYALDGKFQLRHMQKHKHVSPKVAWNETPEENIRTWFYNKYC